jgi:hypothetical protein
MADRKTFTIPDGYIAIRDTDGRATGQLVNPSGRIVDAFTLAPQPSPEGAVSVTDALRQLDADARAYRESASLYMSDSDFELNLGLSETAANLEESLVRSKAALLPAPQDASPAQVSGPWCQPMENGKHKLRHFIVRFEDAQRNEAVFTDEAEAYEFWRKANVSWNCWLFGAMPLSAQDAPSASLAERDVLAERRRQVEVEGWTPDHDDAHSAGELARAAACYALFANSTQPMFTVDHETHVSAGHPIYWPWATSWWKPTDRRRNLVKAGALIIAEIDRLDRLPASPEQGEAP